MGRQADKEEIALARYGMKVNADRMVAKASKVACDYADTLPNADYSIAERTPDLEALGSGRELDTVNIPQFGSGSTVKPEDIPA